MDLWHEQLPSELCSVIKCLLDPVSLAALTCASRADAAAVTKRERDAAKISILRHYLCVSWASMHSRRLPGVYAQDWVVEQVRAVLACPTPSFPQWESRYLTRLADYPRRTSEIVAAVDQELAHSVPAEPAQRLARALDAVPAYTAVRKAWEEQRETWDIAADVARRYRNVIHDRVARGDVDPQGAMSHARAMFAMYLRCREEMDSEELLEELRHYFQVEAHYIFSQ